MKVLTFKFVEIRSTMRQCLLVFFVLDLLWWTMSAFPQTRFSLAPQLELIPVLDIVGLTLHLSLIVIAAVFRWRMGLLVLITLLWISLFAFRHGLPDQPCAPSDGMQHLRVATLNVQQFGNQPEQLDSLAIWAKSMQVDILCLQEFGLMNEWPDTDEPKERFAALSGLEEAHFQPHLGNVFGTAVFSRYPVQLDTVLVTSVPNFNEVKSYVVHFNGSSFSLLNAHLESFNHGFSTRVESTLSKRAMQVQVIESYCALLSNDALLLGDFNTVPGTRNYARLRAIGRDAQKASGSGILSTHASLPIRIDIAFGPDKWHVSGTILQTPIPSDHRALVVDYLLP